MQRRHAIAQGRDGTGLKRAGGVIGAGVVVEWRVIGHPGAADRFGGSVPGEVRRDHDATARYVSIQVVAQRCLVKPAAVREGKHDLVRLQLGERGRAGRAVKQIHGRDARLSSQER